MNVLVTAGTGTVGREVVLGLLRLGMKPRVLSRSKEKVLALPTNVWGVLGDLEQPESLRAALREVDRLVLITPESPTETEAGLAAVAAAGEARLERVVLLSAMGADECRDVLRFRSKIAIEKALWASGLPFTVVLANDLFQNDVAARSAIVDEGLYPRPIGSVGLSRVDARDVADALVAAVSEDAALEERYPLVGTRGLDGAQVAEAWGCALGQRVVYAGDDLDVWEDDIGRSMPSWRVGELRATYRHFQLSGLLASVDDLSRQARLLGRSPRRFDDFTAEMAQTWKAAR